MNILEPEDKPKGLNYSVVSSKNQVKKLEKQLARRYFLYLHVLASGNLGLLSVVLILDI